MASSTQIVKISRRVILEELSKVTAADIMVPRSEVVLLNMETSFSSIIETVLSDGHSRFPVYSGKIDNIVGILYVKDLLQFFKSIEVEFNVSKILRKPLFVSENKKASELLSEFKDERIHLAIVVDEYGTMLGIVSLEDILEEIVGDISDEYDKDAHQSYEVINQNESLLYPRMALSEFNTVFKTKIISDDYETIGGFILDRFGYVPKEGESFQFSGYTFEIIQVEGSRIKKVLLKKG